jgi:16S rRNA A1518/A1519 N6-dimethyltransferase RsmA/KsgA/DIM1 with predicted DNA glycosylase/AP lyase activity
LDVIESDVLKVDFTALAKRFRERLNQTLRLRVVGNLPYNISTPILFHLLEHVDVIRPALHAAKGGDRPHGGQRPPRATTAGCR